MKKSIVLGLLFVNTFISQAQTDAEKIIIDGYKKTKEKSDVNISNPKANLKARTWLERAQAYENIAIYAMSVDSSAADVAMEAYKKAIELDTKNGKEGSVAKEAKTALTGKALHDSYIQVGAANYSKQNYSKAQSAFKTASIIDPKDTVATMYYGVASQQLNDDASIIDAYEKHINLGGNDPVVYYGLFNSYKKAKNDDKAIAILSKGIEKNPNNKDLKAEKTNYFISSGKIDMAIQSLKDMIEKDSKNVNNLLNLAILYDNAGTVNNDKIKKLSDQINQGSGVQEKFDSKASQVQAYTDERNRLKEQLKKQPKNPDVKRRLSEAELFLKEQTDVLNTLKEEKAAEDAKKINVADVKTQIDALVKIRDADKTNAIGNYKKALDLEPENYDANFNLGVMSFNEGVELKRPYDNLNPTSTEYKNNGKAMEDRFVSKFMEALPFFETAYKVKKEVEIKDNLKNLYRILKMEDKLKAIGE